MDKNGNIFTARTGVQDDFARSRVLLDVKGNFLSTKVGAEGGAGAKVLSDFVQDRKKSGQRSGSTEEQLEPGRAGDEKPGRLGGVNRGMRFFGPLSEFIWPWGYARQGVCGDYYPGYMKPDSCLNGGITG